MSILVTNALSLISLRMAHINYRIVENVCTYVQANLEDVCTYVQANLENVCTYVQANLDLYPLQHTGISMVRNGRIGVY